MKDKLVALVIENGKCKLLCDVKSIEKQEYNKLLNEQEEHKANELRKEEKHNKVHIGLKGKSKEHDLLLAKCIYDNFVDKGLINADPQFDNEWFDYFFNGCELKLDNAPQEYEKILDKVVNDYEK